MAPDRAPARRPNRVFVRVERWILSVGMGLMAFVIERRLLRALKKGGVTTAPRTAAGHTAAPEETAEATAPGEWAFTPHLSEVSRTPENG